MHRANDAFCSAAKMVICNSLLSDGRGRHRGGGLRQEGGKHTFVSKTYPPCLFAGFQFQFIYTAQVYNIELIGHSLLCLRFLIRDIFDIKKSAGFETGA